MGFLPAVLIAGAVLLVAILWSSDDNDGQGRNSYRAPEGHSGRQTRFPEYSRQSTQRRNPVQDSSQDQQGQAYARKLSTQRGSEYQDTFYARQEYERQKNSADPWSRPDSQQTVSGSSPSRQGFGHQIDGAENLPEAGGTREHYTTLRSRAIQEGDLMAQCYRQSQEAYQRGDRALAKQLSEEGGIHKQKMEKLNTSASAWIFRGWTKLTDMKNREVGEVDLHDLYVKEAIAYAEKAIEKARKQGTSKIRLIVGKGLHSERNEAKIKPALEEFMKG
ncbi:hypothetical protein SCLCIDRAFT_19526 [Scleroderma citrinum Foug A]|uniref:Smr domain-containing protein n=1 Tax=Scleroderma citrinum Foug A TaxID=1036808 RepID=A0A0C3EAJ1_9AGAM|nr:hypothetical protein SCLCIDRAFT_19526 [Scleroderma citrinum Foug A]